MSWLLCTGPSKGKKGKTKSGNEKKYRSPKDEKKQKQSSHSKYSRDESKEPYKRCADRGTDKYRDRLSDQEDDTRLNANLLFYRNEIPSRPNGDYITQIHERWWGDYDRLERHHGYIQWLFPIRERGMNNKAQPLQSHEAEEMKDDPRIRRRILESYEMMLDFYGMKLVNEDNGKLVRKKNWRERFSNLKRNPHNYLRITRILRCLGELGYEHLKKGLVSFLLQEALVEGTLTPALKSCKDYWIGTLKDGRDRKELYRFIEEHEKHHDDDDDY